MYSPHAIRQSFIDFASSVAWQFPMALTLTLKQRVGGIAIDHVAAAQNFRHFMNRLNRRVFGNSAARHGRGLNVIPVIENDEIVRLHYHAVIDRPERMTPEEFRRAIDASWRKTLWGYNQLVLEPMTNNGWINYIGKFGQKPDYALAIDWTNARTDS
jgi:hypothetical protein